MGGFASTMGWSLLTQGYSFSLNVGVGMNGLMQGGASFIVNNSGIIFQGIGYTTIAGGGAFLTYETIKGLNNSSLNVKKPKWNGCLFLSPNIFQISRVYNKAHTHPRNTSPSPADLKFSYLFGISGIVFGWNGSVYNYGGNEYWK